MEKRKSNEQQLRREDFIYTSCYCEENIWKFLEQQSDKDSLYAVFISNDVRQVPIFAQRLCQDQFTPVVWDYHVIAIDKAKGLVYDFDTTLEFPEDFASYSSQALPRIPIAKYKRLFRVLSAKYYLANFASNRSHMIDKLTGKYQAEPPSYPCIRAPSTDNNIQEFIDMTNKTIHGTVMSQDDFERFFK